MEQTPAKGAAAAGFGQAGEAVAESGRPAVPGSAYHPGVHPMERLRYVARAGDVPVVPLVRESAAALVTMADDPMGLLTSCRRLVDRRPGCAPLVWLAARMLTGADPRSEARDAMAEIEADPTGHELDHGLGHGWTVAALDDSDIAGPVLRSRPDLQIVPADPDGLRPGTAADDLYGLEPGDDNSSGPGTAADDPSGLDTAANDSSGPPLSAAAAGPDRLTASAGAVDVVVLESDCVGPSAALVPPGAVEAADRARASAVPVWLVAGVGRVLPERMWDLSMAGLGDDGLADGGCELLDLDRLVTRVVTPVGLRPPDRARSRIDCPVAPELFRTG